MRTHLGIRPEDHVVLERIGDETQYGAWQRTFPNGTSVSPFLIPEGRLLVITDVACRIRVSETPPSSNINVTLLLARLEDLQQSVPVHWSTILLDANGSGGVSESAASGFIANEEVTIIWEQDAGGDAEPGFILRGYLMDLE